MAISWRDFVQKKIFDKLFEEIFAECYYIGFENFPPERMRKALIFTAKYWHKLH